MIFIAWDLSSAPQWNARTHKNKTASVNKMKRIDDKDKHSYHNCFRTRVLHVFHFLPVLCHSWKYICHDIWETVKSIIQKRLRCLSVSVQSITTNNLIKLRVPFFICADNSFNSKRTTMANTAFLLLLVDHLCIVTLLPIWSLKYKLSIWKRLLEEKLFKYSLLIELINDTTSDIQ